MQNLVFAFIGGKKERKERKLYQKKICPVVDYVFDTEKT